MVHNNKHKATVTLVMVVVGYLASYPFSHSFAGGLLTATFGAAMIGGLADWFAVSALFRRPLGIPFRTAVIPRNRERIFESIVDMVQNQLLTPDNIGRTLDRFDMADLLLRYWQEHGGRQDVHDLLLRIGRDITVRSDATAIGRMVEQLIRQSAARVEIAPLVAEALEWSVRNGYDEKLVDFLLIELQELFKGAPFCQLTAGLFVEARRAYERDMLRRQLANRLLEHFLNLSPQHLAELAQEKLVSFLQECRSSPQVRNHFRAWIDGLVARLKEEASFRQRIEAWKMEILSKQLNLREPIAGLVVALQTGGDGGSSSYWLTLLTGEADSMLANVAADPKRRAAMSETARTVFLEAVAAHHEEIGRIVRERLDQFSDTMLSDFIESRVGNDLQMIRINGSVVGGLAGMMLFILTYWLL